jgi:hypothetical protein
MGESLYPLVMRLLAVAEADINGAKSILQEASEDLTRMERQTIKQDLERLSKIRRDLINFQKDLEGRQNYHARTDWHCGGST